MKTAQKMIPSKLEELEVMFVSGVAQPATGERFILLKDARATSAFGEWVQHLRAVNPFAAAEMDMYFAAGDADNLRLAVKSTGNAAMSAQVEQMLAAVNLVTRDWTDIEPTLKALDAWEDADPVTLLDMLAYKRDWTDAERTAHQKNNGYFAGPNKSFPLKNCTDVHAAYMSANRATGVAPDTIRARVSKWANEHNMERCLPETAQENATDERGTDMDDMQKSKNAKPYAQDKAAGNDPDMDNDIHNEGQEAPDENTRPHKIAAPKKRGGAGMANSMMTAMAKTFADAAGLEVVPAGTTEMLAKLEQASAAMSKSIAGGAGADDDPVHGAVTRLDEMISMAANAPKTEKVVGDGKAPDMAEQADVLRGTPFDGSADATTILAGMPFAGSVDLAAIVSGSPAQKSARR